jgi:prolipoprotein diacylglyceryltransferase
MTLVRYVIIALAAGVMIAGVLIVLGVIELRNLPPELRTVMGIVVILYGAYRLVVEFTRKPKE